MIKKYQELTKPILYLIITIVLTLGLSLSFRNLFADWSSPVGDPPINNTKGPIFNDSTDSDPVNWPIVNHPLGITGNLTMGGNIIMDNGRITGLVDPINDGDIVNKNWADSQVGGTAGCTNFTLRTTPPPWNAEVLCNSGEKLVAGGCTFDFDVNDDFPVVSSYPTLSMFDDQRPGWFCSYVVRRYISHPKIWYGSYAGTAWVICCN